MSNSMNPEPGPEHEWFRRHAGNWDAKITVNPYPGAPPVEWSGEMTISLGCGGLWEIMDFRGDMGGKPFHGHGVAGFDPNKQQYVQCWVDSMSSSLLLLSGNLDEKTRTLTMKGEMQTPLGPSKMRQVTREISRDELEFAIEVPTPDGGHFTLMSAKYRRRT